MSLVTDYCHKPWMEKQKPIWFGISLLLTLLHYFLLWGYARILSVWEDTELLQHLHVSKEQLVTANRTDRREKSLAKYQAITRILFLYRSTHWSPAHLSKYQKPKWAEL